MLSGLLRPTSGTATVAGGAPGSPGSLTRMGAMVETPAFYPYLSGRDNLRVVARYAGVPTSRIEPVLRQVDMTDRAHHKFRTYSTGMKQRLGVAAALLKDPALLILDEPTSGLDPQGTVEMRELIKELRHGGRTVLLSSHLLNEVELTCDRVGVIANLRAESLKTRKRWANWILFGILLLALILLGYVLTYVVLSNPPRNFESRVPARILKREVFPENLIPNMLSLTSTIGAAIMIILGGLSTASEYGWLTAQTILIQKPGRSAVLLGKLVILAIVTLLIAVVVLGASALTSYLLVTIDGGSSSWPSANLLLKGFGALWLEFAVWTAFG